jgi:hypothetical protein
MRRIAAFAFLMTLAVIPFQAEAADGRVFRSADCGPVQCPSAVQDAMAYVTALTNFANKCVNRLGKGSPDGFFRPSFPDGSGCLATKDITPSNGGVALVPKCCLSTTPEAGSTSCQMQCSLLEKR